MDYKEIIEKQSKEYGEYLSGYKEGLDQLNQDKANLLNSLNWKEADLPDFMKDKLNRDKEAFKENWGMYGTKFKAMRISHQKEIDKYFYRQEIVQNLEKDQSKDKSKQRGAER